jgi:uncharacterized protein (TIGR02001 family)
VIAPAAPAVSLPGRTEGSSFAARACLFASFLLAAVPTDAQQLGAAVSVYSDSRFRGYSLSEERPVAVLDLSYDDPSGIYVALSGSGVASREGPRFLGVQVNGGYAKRLHSGLTLDVGAVHSAYSHYSGLGGSRSYTELYAGMTLKSVSSRLSVSPDYFGRGWTVHPEVTGRIQPARNLNISADIGLLIPLRQPTYWKQSYTIYDARLGVDQAIGRFTLHGALTSRGKDRNIYTGHRASRNAIIVGLSYAL